MMNNKECLYNLTKNYNKQIIQFSIIHIQNEKTFTHLFPNFVLDYTRGVLHRIHHEFLSMSLKLRIIVNKQWFSTNKS